MTVIAYRRSSNASKPGMIDDKSSVNCVYFTSLVWHLPHNRSLSSYLARPAKLTPIPSDVPSLRFCKHAPSFFAEVNEG